MSAPANSVRIALLDHDDSNLFFAVCEADDPDNWKLVGGKYENGEEFINVAWRELTEEVGILEDSINLGHAGTMTNDDGVTEHVILFAYVDKSVVSPTDEIGQSGWFTIDSLPDGPNSDHIRTAMSMVADKIASSNPAKESI